MSELLCKVLKISGGEANAPNAPPGCAPVVLSTLSVPWCIVNGCPAASNGNSASKTLTLATRRLRLLYPAQATVGNTAKSVFN